MNTLIIALTAACAVVSAYFGVRHFTCKDLGLTPARKYVRNLAENLLHTNITAALEAGTTPNTTSEQAAQQTATRRLVATTSADVKQKG